MKDQQKIIDELVGCCMRAANFVKAECLKNAVKGKHTAAIWRTEVAKDLDRNIGKYRQLTSIDG